MTKADKARVYWTIRIIRDALENLREVDLDEETEFGVREMNYYADKTVNQLWDEVEGDGNES